MKIDGITTISGVDVLSGSKLLNFTIADPVDPTKEFLIDVSGVTTATTRTITFPDQDLDFTPDTGTFASASTSLETISSITPAKGTLIAGSGTIPGEWASLAVGANGTVLIADSTAANGVRWFALGVSTTFPDDTFRIQNAADPTREIAFSAANITTATTRTITMPDADVDLTLVGTALQSSDIGVTVQGFNANTAITTAGATWTGIQNFRDNSFFVYNAGDPTKFVRFDVSGTAGGTTRTITIANQNVSLVPGVTYAAAGSGLTAVQDDLAPVLGGNLNTNGNFIEVTTGTGIRDLNSNEQLFFNTTAAAATYFEITNATTGNPPVLSAAGEINTSLSIQPAGTGNVILGNFPFDGDQVVGAGQDNFVLTYDNALGIISLEASTGGGGVSVQEEGSPIPNTPHTTLNFIGAGVTATDAGAGVANITVTGGGGGGGTGNVVQIQESAVGTVATGTTQTPLDNTIPQITEGDEFMTVAITPTNSNNLLIVEVQAVVSLNGVGSITGALFQDSTADALTSSLYRCDPSNAVGFITLSTSLTAGTTSSTTFRFRAGRQTGIGTTVTLNGSNGTQIYGGVANSYIRVTEVDPGNVLTVQTTTATQTTIGSISVASGSSQTFSLKGQGHESATGDTFSSVINGCIRNQGGTTTLVGSLDITQFNDAGAATWDITAVANDTSDALDIKVTGEAAKTIDWKIVTETVEV